MKFGKEQLLSLLRMLLSAGGAFLFGKNLFGNTVDAVLWEQLIGVVLVIVSIAWSAITKSTTIEQIQGSVRQVITVIGGLMVSGGYITGELYASILGIAAAIFPWFQAGLARSKSEQLDTGKISIDQLKK